jgi:hypothetical protein
MVGQSTKCSMRHSLYWHQQRQPLLLTRNTEVSVLSLRKSRELVCRVRNTMPHEMGKITSASDQGHFDFSYPVPAPSPVSQFFHSHPSFLCCWFKVSNSAHVPCKFYKFGLLKCIFSLTLRPNDAPQLLRLLWTSDQLVAETSTWQHTPLTTDKHPCPG